MKVWHVLVAGAVAGAGWLAYSNLRPDNGKTVAAGSTTTTAAGSSTTAPAAAPGSTTTTAKAATAATARPSGPATHPAALAPANTTTTTRSPTTTTARAATPTTAPPVTTSTTLGATTSTTHAAVCTVGLNGGAKRAGGFVSGVLGYSYAAQGLVSVELVRSGSVVDSKQFASGGNGNQFFELRIPADGAGQSFTVAGRAGSASCSASFTADQPATTTTFSP